VAAKILERLGLTYGGELPIGDKSAPEEIQKEFPGVSKANFKKAVSSLYKQGIVKPGPFSIELMKHKDNKY
jgi:predicted RNA-binding protein (virulence factor B family)